MTRLVQHDWRHASAAADCITGCEKPAAHLAWWFSSEEQPELMRSLFTLPPYGVKQLCVRGQSAAGPAGRYGFQWSSAVRAICALVLRTMAWSAQPSGARATAVPCLKGGGNSLAASLDYAISKQPAWLINMFGRDPHGMPMARRLTSRINPERKRPGPVVILCNCDLLVPENMIVYAGSRRLSDSSVWAKMALTVAGDSASLVDASFASQR